MDIPVQKHYPFIHAHAILRGMQLRPTHVTLYAQLLEPKLPINASITLFFSGSYKTQLHQRKSLGITSGKLVDLITSTINVNVKSGYKSFSCLCFSLAIFQLRVEKKSFVQGEIQYMRGQLQHRKAWTTQKSGILI